MSAMGYPGLKTDLEQLKRFGAHADGGWNRPAYSSVDCQTHEWAAGLMRDAGLRVRYDPAGNLIGRLEPVRGGSGAAVAIGSHLDTVFRGGWLDGGLGVLAGIEIARRLKGEADRLRRPLEVIAFRDEEGRFGAYIGSRAMAGQITEQQLPKLKDPAGVHLVDCLASCDLRVDRFLEAARPRSELAAYLE
ncbi:MAG: M20/M25/M40 family metallo-hydrolase, partial [bacterium]